MRTALPQACRGRSHFLPLRPSGSGVASRGRLGGTGDGNFQSGRCAGALPFPPPLLLGGGRVGADARERTRPAPAVTCRCLGEPRALGAVLGLSFRAHCRPVREPPSGAALDGLNRRLSSPPPPPPAGLAAARLPGASVGVVAAGTTSSASPSPQPRRLGSREGWELLRLCARLVCVCVCGRARKSRVPLLLF